MAQNQNRSLLELVGNRSGERLVQGALLYLLQSDTGFRKCFLSWAKFRLPKGDLSFREEVPGDGMRHDIVVLCRGRIEKRVELKLHTGETRKQKRARKSIDMWIARDAAGLDPQCRKKTRTWAELQEQFGGYQPFDLVLSGVGALAVSAESLDEGVAEQELMAWENARDCEAFLHAIRLSLQRSGWTWKGGSSELSHWGYYLRSIQSRKGFKDWLWVGFVRHLSGKWKLCAQSNLSLPGFGSLDRDLVERSEDRGVVFEPAPKWRREVVTKKLGKAVEAFVKRCRR